MSVRDVPINLVVFGSGVGSNLKALLTTQKRFENRGAVPPFRVRALFTDRKCPFQAIGQSEGIPVVYQSFVRYFRDRGVVDLLDTTTRIAFDSDAVAAIDACASEGRFSVDLIILAGYMRILYTPLLQAYSQKILNVHPADLTALDSIGRRRYPGSNAVELALADGKTSTRSCTFVVDEGMDTGPILVSGPWVDYTEGLPITKERCRAHQDKQKSLSDWPSLIAAVTLYSKGRLQWSGQSVTLDGKNQGPAGVDLAEYEHVRSG